MKLNAFAKSPAYPANLNLFHNLLDLKFQKKSYFHKVTFEDADDASKKIRDGSFEDYISFSIYIQLSLILC